MQVRVDTGRLVGAADLLGERAGSVRGLLGASARLPETLREPVLRRGVAALADVVADALELVAIDLVQLSGRVRAGAVVYDGVEVSVRRAGRR